MKKLFGLCCILFFASFLTASEEDDATLVKVGQPAPEFQVTTLADKTFDLKAAKGKVVLVNFFATWCGPCMAEMPHLQDQIWNRFKDKNFVMVAIDREETEVVVKAFQAKHQFGFSIACDLKREVYSKFATKFIPRNFLINAEGKVVYLSTGYGEAEFKKLIAAIDQELGKAH